MRDDLKCGVQSQKNQHHCPTKLWGVALGLAPLSRHPGAEAADTRAFAARAAQGRCRGRS